MLCGNRTTKGENKVRKMFISNTLNAIHLKSFRIFTKYFPIPFLHLVQSNMRMHILPLNKKYQYILAICLIMCHQNCFLSEKERRTIFKTIDILTTYMTIKIHLKIYTGFWAKTIFCFVHLIIVRCFLWKWFCVISEWIFVCKYSF